jgi:hypothetical protein
MPPSTTKHELPTHLSAGRLWAEQLAAGGALLIGLLTFMSIYHPAKLSVGAEVLGPNYLSVYGWASVVGIVLQVIVHETGTLLMAKWLHLPLQFRFFGFGANATAILEKQPRHTARDAVLALAGPLTGTIVSLLLAGIYVVVKDLNSLQINAPLFLGMACVGYFYNLFTLIPILDLEGGWVAPALAPQAWLGGLIACTLMLTGSFNLVLLCVVCFGLPRFFQLITARARRADLTCNSQQRWVINVLFFALVLFLSYLSSATFQWLPEIIRDTMGD